MDMNNNKKKEIEKIRENMFQMKEQKQKMYDSEEDEDVFGRNKNSRLSDIFVNRSSVSYGQMKKIDVKAYS